MLLRTERLASHVAAHAGVSPPLAEYALRAVVAGIGGYLSPAFRQLVADELPQPLATALASALTDSRPIEDRVQLTTATATVGLSGGNIVIDTGNTAAQQSTVGQSVYGTWGAIGSTAGSEVVGEF